VGLRSSWYDCCREHGGRARLALVSSTSASLVSQQLSWTLHHFAKRKSAAAGASKAVLDAALRVFAVVPGEMLPDAEWYEVLRARLQAQGSHLVGTATVMHEAQARAAADGIEAAMPNGGVVLNMLDELERSKDLLEALQERSMPAGIYEVVSIHITESDTASLGALLDDQWVALTYFATLGRSQNSLFLDAIEAKYGLDASARPAITEDMEAAWTAVHLWAAAVRKAGTFVTKSVQAEAWMHPFNAPGGTYQMHGNNYVSKISRLGTVNARGTGFRMIAQAPEATAPDPFWLYPSRAQEYDCDFSKSLELLCPGGKGLVAEGGVFVHSMEHAAACTWCTPGKHSVLFEQKSEPATKICQSCPAGQIQSSPGQESCHACEAGFFTFRQKCKRCAAGSFATAEGSTACEKCPESMTTELLGATNLTDCHCVKGFYATSDGCEGCGSLRTTEESGAADSSACFFEATFYLALFSPLILLVFVAAALVAFRLWRWQMHSIEVE